MPAFPEPALMRAATPADFAAIHRLNAEIETHDQLPIATSLAEFEDWAHDPYLDLGRDTRLAEENGALVGWARVMFRPSGHREERAYVFGGTSPEARGRGTGTRLMRWGIERSKHLLRATGGSLPLFVRAQCYEFQHDLVRLYRRHGMVPARYGEEMIRDLDELPAPAAAEGVSIVGWDAARSEEARLVMNAAFAEHWGSAPRDPAAWAHEIAGFGVRLDLSFFAIAEGRIAGLACNSYYPDDEAVTGMRAGWIQRLGVLPGDRKRGVASALIAASLATFRAAGFTHAALGVDSANPSGANRLYKAQGFATRTRTTTFQLHA